MAADPNLPATRDIPLRRLVTINNFQVDDAHPVPVHQAGATGPFGDVITTARRPVFSHQSTDDLSILRDKVSTVNNGTVTSTTSEFRVNAPAAGDEAMLSSSTRGRYVPGFAAEGGFGLRLASRSAGGILDWGLLDDDNGMFFRLDDTGLNAVILRNGIETNVVNRADFSVDKLDGTGPSGINFNDFGSIEGFLQDGVIFQVRFTWYGYGVIEWSFVDVREVPPEVFPAQRTWVMHRIKVNGDTSIEDPNLPIRYYAFDGVDTYVGGRQYSVLGTPDVQERNVGAWRYQQSIPAASIGAGGTPLDSDWVPLVSIRRRTDVPWAAGIGVVTDDLEIISDRKLVVQEFIGPTTTGGSWVSVPYTDGQSAVEVNLTGTGITFPGGTFPNQTIALDPLIVQGGGGVNESRNQSVTKRTPLPEDQELILAAFVPGANSASVDSVLDWLEIR